MKTTLNPFENAKRTAQGTGGISPSVIEEIQAEITVLGSQNETQAQDITDIKTQLEELAGAYSTTEHKTGRKWIDGKDIFEKTISLDSKVWIETSSETVIADAPANIDQLINASLAIMRDGTTNAVKPIMASISNGKLRGQALTFRTELKMITIWYTKTGA